MALSRFNRQRQGAALLLIVGAIALARDKKPPSGDAFNDLVTLHATIIDADELKQIFNSDFDNSFAVIEVTVTPQPEKTLEVRLDDFLLRSESSGVHSGPFMAGQIAGQGTLVVHQADQPRSKGGFGAGLGGIMMGGGSMGPGQAPEVKAEIKSSSKKDPMLDILKRKILAERTVTEPASGLLFFPLEKEKPKNLELVYTTSAGKLKLRFK